MLYHACELQLNPVTARRSISHVPVLQNACSFLHGTFCAAMHDSEATALSTIRRLIPESSAEAHASVRFVLHSTPHSVTIR